MDPLWKGILHGLMATGIGVGLAFACADYRANGQTQPVPKLRKGDINITGRARVIDGDGLSINGQHLRLWGIDAPELKQTCLDGFKDGMFAHEYLVGLTMGQDISCRQVDFDTKYNRPLVICGRINSAMVEAGWAWAFRRYTTTYVPMENEARAAKRGVWGHVCTEPWVWRQTTGRKPGQ